MLPTTDWPLLAWLLMQLGSMAHHLTSVRLPLALVLAASASCSNHFDSVGSQLDRIADWWIFIGGSAEATALDRARAAGVELVVLNDHPRLPVGFGSSTIRLAYLSVGEAEMGRAYWPQVRGTSIVVERNLDWSHNVRIDIRDRRWQAILLDQEAPRLLARGYHGFMLDTLDTAPYLEAKDPARFAGSRQALRRFLATMRRSFPRAVLLANATEALVDAAPYVDAYVVESVFATYDLESRRYRETTPHEREWRLAQVQAALAVARRPVFSIEYASSAGLDASLGDWASRRSREQGFRPTVTTRELDQMPAAAK
jgi:endo-alpha-1,4-polygalactosaminidase (GH114 family)